MCDVFKWRIYITWKQVLSQKEFNRQIQSRVLFTNLEFAVTPLVLRIWRNHYIEFLVGTNWVVLVRTVYSVRTQRFILFTQTPLRRVWPVSGVHSFGAFTPSSCVRIKYTVPVKSRCFPLCVAMSVINSLQWDQLPECFSDEAKCEMKTPPSSQNQAFLRNCDDNFAN